MKISDLNPWWKTGEVKKEFSELEKRDIYEEVVKYLKDKQIIAITGLRRTGKTVLMHHLINHLLKEFPKESIFYYSFDLFDDKIENIINNYEETLNLNSKKAFIFIDEIQKHENWENELKVLYDNFPNFKFFISGSSSLFIQKKTKESLAGRVFTFNLKPLTLKEYLRLKKASIYMNRLVLYEKEIKSHIKHYMRTGGFPELLHENDEDKIEKYIKELVIDKIVYMDIPKSFKIDEPELLIRILTIISSNPGIIIDYDNLARDLKRNRRTISNYISYLEKAFLIKKMYNYSKNILTSEKKMKRFYPASTSFAYLFNAEEGRIIENVAIMNLNLNFFSRVGDKEVDFIAIEKNKIKPIEVKYTTNEIKQEDIKGLLNFIEKNNLNEGFVLTRDYNEIKSIKNKKIHFIPLWRWLLRE